MCREQDSSLNLNKILPEPVCHWHPLLLVPEGSPGMCPITALLWLRRNVALLSQHRIKNNRNTCKGFRGKGQGLYLLVPLHYLSRQLHFMHGLQPALHQLRGAEDQGSEGRGEGACSGVLQITAREKLQRVFGHRPSAQQGRCTSYQLLEPVPQALSNWRTVLGERLSRGRAAPWTREMKDIAHPIFTFNSYTSFWHPKICIATFTLFLLCYWLQQNKHKQTFPFVAL